MRREQRLARTRDFEQVRREGRTVPLPLVVAQVAPNGLEWSRFGFIVSKRLGGAVERNRVKRRLREAARLEAFPPGWDIVLIARRPVAEAPFEAIRQTMQTLRRRARLDRTAVMTR